MTTVDDIWQHVVVGGFVAVSLEKYEKVPVIGEVLEKHSTTLKIHYWKGSWNKKWEPWFIGRDEPWTDDLPQNCIYLASFELTDQSKLYPDTKRQMKAFLSKG